MKTKRNEEQKKLKSKVKNKSEENQKKLNPKVKTKSASVDKENRQYTFSSALYEQCVCEYKGSN